MEDLGFLKFVDIQALLIGSTTVTWRKVERVASYIYSGESVRTATTMADITASLVVAHSTIAGTSTTSVHTADPSKGAPKLHVNALSEFDGQPINYKDWEKGYKATLGQTVYAPLITSAPAAGDTIMGARDKELFFMLTSALMKSSGMHVINAMSVESGFQAIQDIE